MALAVSGALAPVASLIPRPGSRLVIKLRDDVIVFTAKLNFRYVTQTNLRTVLVHFQQNIAEFVSGFRRVCAMIEAFSCWPFTGGVPPN